MKIGLICFTARGTALCRVLFSRLRAEGEDCRAWIPRRHLPDGWQDEGLELQVLPVSQWAGQMFAEGRGMIFVGAVGIAVRAIAPWIRDKMTDPPVAAVDEAGRFAIPLLSGHVGGANALARRISRITGAVPVITTATDVNRTFAVDLFAVGNGLAITDRREAMEISAGLLAGDAVGFFSDFPVDELPAGCVPRLCRHNIWVTLRAGGHPETARGLEEAEGPGADGCPENGGSLDADGYPQPEKRGAGASFLRLVPQKLVLGVGCRRDTDPDVLAGRIRRIFEEENMDLAGVKALATIDCKKDENAIRRLAEENGWELRFYSAGELAQLAGDFSESEFVRETVGVGNVCERAACARGGRLVFGKRAGEGITAAAALEGPVEINAKRGFGGEADAGKTLNGQPGCPGKKIEKPHEI